MSKLPALSFYEILTQLGAGAVSAPFIIHNTKVFPALSLANLPLSNIIDIGLNDAFSKNDLFFYAFMDVSGAGASAQSITGNLKLISGDGLQTLSTPFSFGNPNHTGGTRNGSSIPMIAGSGGTDYKNSLPLRTGYTLTNENLTVPVQARSIPYALSRVQLDVTDFETPAAYFYTRFFVAVWQYD